MTPAKVATNVRPWVVALLRVWMARRHRRWPSDGAQLGLDVPRLSVPPPRVGDGKEPCRGHPVKVLVDASEGADLLLVGNRGHGGFTGMLLGSVSGQVLAYAHCPTVIVRA